MDKFGLVNLGPGFRFHPTDEELVVDYLKPKSCCCPLPASIIPDFDACTADPWDLPGELGQERYFFSSREAKYPNGNRSNRATSSGYWKATGLDKKVASNNQLLGMKKTLVFYTGKPPHGTRTDWIMHEYRLNNVMVPLENWVLCRVFIKKRGSDCKSRDATTHDCYHEFVKGRTDLNVVPSSACSGSSGITEISSKRSPDREENSSCNSLLLS